MIDVREELKKLPPPDPEAVDRVWERYRDTRKRRGFGMWALALPAGALALAGAAAVALMVGLSASDTPRTVAYDGTATATGTSWSDVVELDVDGRGSVVGTDRDVQINWEAGTITAHVTPNTGTRLAVVTDEARVEVVGTVFSVTRDALGVHTSVDKGKVKVTCAEGFDGFVTPESGPTTCLPTRAALLLGRADALADRDADSVVQLRTVQMGLDRAEVGTVVHEELLVRRMHLGADAGDVDGALKDATLYLQGDPTRKVEIQRFAGWLAMAQKGCDAALPFLEPLATTGSPQDHVLLGECVATTDVIRARTLIEGAVEAGLDVEWTNRAQADLAALEGR